jgi:hypothetical protein
MSEIPRRCDMSRWSVQERAIDRAVRSVELMGADVRLTDAVVLLGAARDSVADYIDHVDARREVTLVGERPQKTKG